MTTDDLMNDYAMLKSTLDRLGIKYRESYENMMIRVEVAYNATFQLCLHISNT